MSDQEIRALERQAQTDPGDADAQIKLFTARRRAGVPIESTFRIRNIKTGKYFQYWSNYDGIKQLHDVTTGAEEFKSRETALKHIHSLSKKGVNWDDYQLVECQTMRLEIAGPPLSTLMDQIEVELLHAKKEQQLRKLQKLETEEQELLKKKTLQEKAKLQKLEAKEADLREKLEAKESKKKVKETK